MYREHCSVAAHIQEGVGFQRDTIFPILQVPSLIHAYACRSLNIIPIFIRECVFSTPHRARLTHLTVTYSTHCLMYTILCFVGVLSQTSNATNATQGQYHGMCHTPLDRQASTRKTATTEFGGEAVLILTLFLRSSDRDSDDYVKTRNISRTSKYSVSRSLASQALAYLVLLFAEQSVKRERELSAKR